MKKAIAILLALTLTLTLCSAVAETAESDKHFVVTLAANPTTGYTWQYVLSNDSVATVEEDFLTSADIDALAGLDPTEEFISGAGGFSVFTVKGVKPGDVLLALEYSQAWEKDEDAEAGVTYLLRVAEDLSVVCVASTLAVDD